MHACALAFAKAIGKQSRGARLVGGDLDLTAVGTVTYVKGDVVLAFGHPMAGLGATDLPLVAAYVHGVLPSSELSFKLASGGQALGRFTEDRPWCIGGRLGKQSDLVETSLKITDRDRGLVRNYGVRVIRNRSSLPCSGSYLGGAIESVGPPAEGTTHARFVVEAKGLPRMERENTYTVEGGGAGGRFQGRGAGAGFVRRRTGSRGANKEPDAPGGPGPGAGVWDK